MNGDSNDIQAEISDLANKLSSISMSSLKNLDNNTYVTEFRKIFEKFCKQNPESERYWERLLQTKDSLEKCYNDNIRINELKERMEEAKPKGDLDEVFRDICTKNVPNVMQCALDFMKTLEPCFDHDYVTVRKYYVNITESVSELLCRQDGKFIVLFIAEQGPECLTEVQSDIQKCTNKHFSQFMPTDMSNYASTAMSVVTQVQNCSTLNALSECFVGNLKNCQKNFVPANIVDAIFTKLYKITGCKREKDHMV